MTRKSIIGFVLLLCCVPFYGQRKQTAAERLAAERKKQAQALLITLASEARRFNDLKLRARSLARIADTLWETDPEQSRALFLKSWEAAGEADADPNVSYKLGEPRPNLRREVLVLIARRDRRLAEELLQKSIVQEETAKEKPEEDLWQLSGGAQQRLNLAHQLLRSGDVKRALEFADPVLGAVRISTLDFLTSLRDKDPAAADARYAQLLRQTSNNPQAEPNTVSLLASYLFTPRMYVLFNAQGSADASWSENPLPPVNASPELTLMFFQTASDVLMRPLPPDQDETRSSDVALKYLVMKRLLPLFEQQAPRSLTDAVRGQLQVLNSLVNERLREADKEWVDRGIQPEKTRADREQALLDQAERVDSSDERDSIYFQLASLAISKDDETARNYVSKIADSDFRKQAQQWIDWALAVRAIRQKKTDAAVKLARSDALSHIQRVWILTQSARLIVAADSDRAVSLVDEATAAARRIDGSDDRARGLFAVAHTLMVVEPTRVWEALFEAVKAANSSETFTGEDGSLLLTITTKREIKSTIDEVPEFDIKETLGQLANKNFDRAVEVAQGFERDAPRANATIAICRAVLSEKATTAGSKSPAK